MNIKIIDLQDGRISVIDCSVTWKPTTSYKVFWTEEIEEAREYALSRMGSNGIVWDTTQEGE